eukprot:5394935-Pyramimonas_sp.AAC.1
MASANALTQYCSRPGSDLAHSRSWRESSISGAPPPAMRKGRCTRHRTTHSASCRERSASSSTSLLDPRTTTVAVRPMFWIPVTCVAYDRYIYELVGPAHHHRRRRVQPSMLSLGYT